MQPEAIHRLLDASLNRAREALRTIEDHARFLHDDAAAADEAKRARHALRDLAELLGGERLLASRDVSGDVGRDLKTPQELLRDQPDAIIRAAFARLQEALRSIGEFAKLIDPQAAADAERLRYQAYSFEQRMLARGKPLERFRAVRLYVILAEAVARRPWREAAAAALDGGAGCLQLREKNLSDAEMLRRAAWLRGLTRERGALLFINDRPDVARLCDADGVHVGQDDLPPESVRRILGGDRLIGLSTHTAGQLDAALERDADLLAVGPIFPSRTKPQEHVAGIAALRYAASRADRPLIAIGGITADAAAEVRAAGASCICVCSAVIGAEDPRSAAAEFIAALPDQDEPTRIV